MTRFGQWVNDMRWAMNVKRARAWRRKRTFSQRRRFDDELRPRLKDRFNHDVIAYPDAFYEVTVDDLCRAMIVSSLIDPEKK